VLRRTAHAAAIGAPAQAVPAQVSGAQETQPTVLYFAGWRMDFEAWQLYDPKDRPVDLSDGEFRLLRALVQHPRRVLTRDQLVQYALGAESDSYDRAIDVQISRLRRKLALGEVRADLIRTVRNEGYMFVPAVTRTREA
ncbi:MAG TPA: helix-turn-helix domain-containing protein, partial [Variovorax sp.]|nr:helix-turn-helix domain-containing protein [Variovorax sp.]